MVRDGVTTSSCSPLAAKAAGRPSTVTRLTGSAKSRSKEVSPWVARAVSVVVPLRVSVAGW
jgi:hypothetical protein